MNSWMNRHGPGHQGDGKLCPHRPLGQSDHTGTVAPTQGLADADLVQSIHTACPGRMCHSGETPLRPLVRDCPELGRGNSLKC